MKTSDRAYDLMLKSGRDWSLGDLGWALWEGSTECARRGEGSHRANKFHRAAGRVVAILKRQGRVREISYPDRSPSFRALKGKS